MIRRVIGIAVLTIGLAACNPQETQPEKAAVPPADGVTLPEPVVQPSEQVLKLWVGKDLVRGFKGSPLMIYEKSDGGVTLLRKEGDTMSREGDAAGKTSGARVMLDQADSGDLSGKTVKITATVKAVSAESVPFKMAYSTAAKGNSGFTDFTATETPVAYSMTYTVSEGEDTNEDYIGFLVDGADKVEVSSVAVAIVE